MSKEAIVFILDQSPNMWDKPQQSESKNLDKSIKALCIMVQQKVKFIPEIQKN